jgi:hypothetical protein
LLPIPEDEDPDEQWWTEKTTSRDSYTPLLWSVNMASKILSACEAPLAWVLVGSKCDIERNILAEWKFGNAEKIRLYREGVGIEFHRDCKYRNGKLACNTT